MPMGDEYKQLHSVVHSPPKQQHHLAVYVSAAAYGTPGVVESVAWDLMVMMNCHC